MIRENKAPYTIFPALTEKTMESAKNAINTNHDIE